ncbi:alpha/beta hydrolase family protein [Brevundimonas sp.]
MKFLVPAAVAVAVAVLTPAATNAQTPVREVSIPSGSETLSASVLDGIGDGSRPVIVLFTGFPAGPNIPRVANELQASGYTVVVPRYRGTGASAGAISVDGSRADGAAVVSWLKAGTLPNADPAKIGLLGVSYGGWVALQTAASDQSVRCVAALVPADMGVIAARWSTDAEYLSAWKTDLDSFASDPAMARFGPAGVDGFMSSAVASADSNRLTTRAGDLASRPVFIAGGRQDPAAPFQDHYVPIVNALRSAGAPFAALEFEGGHNPSDAQAAARSFIERNCFPD